MSVVTFAVRMLAEVTLRFRTPRVETFPVVVLLVKAFRVVTLADTKLAEDTLRVRTPRVETLPVTVLLVMTLSVVTF